jgi:hypothetical protein
MSITATKNQCPAWCAATPGHSGEMAQLHVDGIETGVGRYGAAPESSSRPSARAGGP